MTKEHTALYRKYRPAGFEDVIGQDHIVQTLKRSVEKEEIVHAYLFSGSRGIGKTSIARIFARAIGTSDNDITEIDAASNRRIDDARELRETVSSLPFESPYKVYIIDEVHMLTKEAFNALLKTLEEPPEHSIFILATTEVHKLPDTIVSRCQSFNFRRPTIAVVKELLNSVASKEGLDLEPDAAHLIALIADGSFRDALGTLQKVSSSLSSKKITAKDVEDITGSPSTGLVNGLIEAIAEKDAEKGIDVFRKVQEDNFDPELFFERVIQKLRFVILLRDSGAKDIVKEELSEDEYEFVLSLSSRKDLVFGLSELKIFLEALELCGFSSVKTFPLEVAFLDIIKR
ncbi:MAG: DNA polymerase III subunit gamma/tau [Patescibacteria group bacterium]